MNKYKAMLQKGDIVYMNKIGVNCFGSLMFNVPSKITKVYSEEFDYKDCDNAENCNCHLRYDIKALDSTMSLNGLVFDELNIIDLKGSK